MKVWTDHDGAILEISAAAAELLNVAPSSLTRRAFYLYFNGHRHAPLRALGLAGQGETGVFDGVLQPREKKQGVHVRVTVEPAPPNAVLWTISAI
jgi:hypothetical protein